jgi:hypothetical protein
MLQNSGTAVSAAVRKMLSKMMSGSSSDEDAEDAEGSSSSDGDCGKVPDVVTISSSEESVCADSDRASCLSSDEEFVRDVADAISRQNLPSAAASSIFNQLPPGAASRVSHGWGRRCATAPVQLFISRLFVFSIGYLLGCMS